MTKTILCSSHASRLVCLALATGWPRSYERDWRRAGLHAGLTLAARLSPVSASDTRLAELPAATGTYACPFYGPAC